MNNKYPTTKPSLNLDFANTKSLDPRITFRRGTPGTYYDGVTHVKAEENLIDYSEDFNQWEQDQNTIDSELYNAPDGSQTANKIIANSTSANHWMLRNEIISSGKTYTMSIYAKAAGYNYLTIFESTGFADDFTGWVTFNLTGDGSIVYATDIVSHSITNVGNDWYRCSVTAIATSDGSGRFGIKPRPDTQGGMNPAFTGDGSSGMLFWGAQLEQRDAVASYTATNVTPITKYQPKLMTAAADSARFDHDPITGESKGLLIEEQRTNLVQDSEFIEDISTNGVWWNQTATVSSVKKNQTISPTGQLNATKIIYNTNVTSGGLVMKHHTDASTGDVFTGSVYLKAGNLDKVNFYFNARASSGVSVAVPAVIADLSLGVIESTVDSEGMTISDSSIDDVGNGWYRVAMTSTVIAGVDVISLGIYMSGEPTNSATAYDHLFVWGAQMEKATFPTSYIKTTGASATRSADNASITGENFSSWYRQDEGSIYCEAAKKDVPSSVVPVSVDGGTSDYIFLNLRSTESFEIKKNNVYQVSSLGFSGVTSGTYHKIMGAYKKDSAAVSINGLSALNDSACEIPTVNRLTIGLTSGVTQNVYIKKLAYYPQRLTNEQLQNLTK